MLFKDMVKIGRCNKQKVNIDNAEQRKKLPTWAELNRPLKVGDFVFPCLGLIIIDVDSYKGQKLTKKQKEWVIKFGDTVYQETNGGVHLFFLNDINLYTSHTNNVWNGIKFDVRVCHSDGTLSTGVRYVNGILAPENGTIRKLSSFEMLDSIKQKELNKVHEPKNIKKESDILNVKTGVKKLTIKKQLQYLKSKDGQYGEISMIITKLIQVGYKKDDLEVVLVEWLDGNDYQERAPHNVNRIERLVENAQ